MLRWIKRRWNCFWFGHDLAVDLSHPREIIYRCKRPGCKGVYHVRG